MSWKMTSGNRILKNEFGRWRDGRPGRGKVGTAAGRCGRAWLSQKVESRDEGQRQVRQSPQRCERPADPRGPLAHGSSVSAPRDFFLCPVAVVKPFHGFFHTLPGKTWRLQPSPELEKVTGLCRFSWDTWAGSL